MPNIVNSDTDILNLGMKHSLVASNQKRNSSKLFPHQPKIMANVIFQKYAMVSYSQHQDRKQSKTSNFIIS